MASPVCELLFKSKWKKNSAISWWEEKTFRWDDDVVLYLTNMLSWIFIVPISSMKQSTPLGHVILFASGPVFTLWCCKRNVEAENTIQYSYGLCFVPTEAQTYDLQYLRQVHSMTLIITPLHWCGSLFVVGLVYGG